MRKPRASSPDRSSVETAELAEPPSSRGTKCRISLRIEADTRQLIDEAAAILGKSRTAFMIESARREAIDVLLDQHLFVLDSTRYNVFLRALDNPPQPGPRLRSLLRRSAAWQR